MSGANRDCWYASTQQFRSQRSWYAYHIRRGWLLEGIWPTVGTRTIFAFWLLEGIWPTMQWNLGATRISEARTEFGDFEPAAESDEEMEEMEEENYPEPLLPRQRRQRERARRCSLGMAHRARLVGLLFCRLVRTLNSESEHDESEHSTRASTYSQRIVLPGQGWSWDEADLPPIPSSRPLA